MTLSQSYLFKKDELCFTDKMMPAHFIGRKFTRELMDELENLSIDSCGESGEFHTLVVDGPLFTERVPVLFSGQYERDGYVFLPAKLNKK